MKKIVIFIILSFALFITTGCQNRNFSQDNRQLYYLLENNNRKIYSDEKDPLFILNNQKVSIKEELPKTNCTYDCIHKYSEPIDMLDDGGTKIYSYQVVNETYYLIECNKIDSKYSGKDILIGKDKNKLIDLC